MTILAVRHRFNYNVVQIEADGNHIGKALSGSSLPVLTKSGGKKFYKFRGSMDAKDRYGLQLVKVLDVAAYTLDDPNVLHRQWKDVPVGHYCAAALINDSLMFLTDNSELITRRLPAPPPSPKDNVVRLFPSPPKSNQ
ncbi:hypothetical protein AB4525_08300 [Vibrio breoganii]|uniref:hypothetical protein n=1 Tax=Vibrio breoganii TaxID=553239 RepID=UPI000C85165B|nr:hypothetical protein [Vibrio breoganii]PMK31618.1 hypothetical protein BCU03_07065 [Vibrio breoganii]